MTIKKENIMSMRFIVISLLLVSAAIQAQENNSGLLWPTSTPTPAPPVAPRTSGYSFTEGTIGGQPLRTESIHTGKVTITHGSLGSKPVNTSTVQLGNMKLTTGTVGNEAVEVITFGSEKD